MVAPTATSGSEELAARLLPLVMADPVRAGRLAEAALREARRGDDAPAQAVALRALGLAARARHDAATAARHLRASVALAGRHRLATHQAEARMSLALILDDLGRPAAALSEIDRAMLDLRGHRRARATMQRSLILRRLGHDAAALAGYRAALRMFRRYGDRVWEARTLTNRGVLHGYRGNLRMAEADLREAQALYTRLGMSTAAAQVEHNLGFVAAQSGDVPTALAHYDRAQAKLWNTGVDAVSLLDRAELLLAVHLLAEARSAVQEAIAGCEQGRLDSVLGQAYLMLAQVELLADAPASSRAAASAARRIFRRQRRAIWVARARRAELAAVVREGRADRGTLRDLREVATVLLDAGWPQPGWDALLDAAALAARLGEWDTARELLVGLEPVARAAPASQRIRLWHVRALVGLGTGDLAQARRAAAAGLRQAEAYQATLGATELRAGAGWQGAALAGLRLRLALEHGRPAEALLWSQRGRSAALWLPPARPSADPVVARHLAELRRIGGELAAAPASPQRAARLLRRARAVETQVRRRTWRAPGSGPDGQRRDPSVRALSDALGDRVLLELLAVDDTLHALVVDRGRVRHRRLGPLAPVVGELDALRFALRRLLLRRGNDAAATASAAHGLAALEDALLAPVADLIGDRRLVLVPTGALHALPWPMLPRLHGRPVCVTPSATLWWRAQAPGADGSRPPRPDGSRSGRPDGDRLVLVAAPSAVQAQDEAREIAARVPGARVLAGERARVPDALAALDGAGTGHIAAHGEFRTDNPLFSFLMLADGPLTVYDLSAMRRPPALLVLSGCDTGQPAVRPGDELMGLVAALLGMGTRAVIASTGTVLDGATRALMTDVYAHLEAGRSPADALARAQAAADESVRASTASFVCFGAG